jgi:hypothetical protein
MIKLKIYCNLCDQFHSSQKFAAINEDSVNIVNLSFKKKFIFFFCFFLKKNLNHK